MADHRIPIHPHPGLRHRTLRDAAAEGMVLELRCNGCRRRATYLALDLLQVCDPDHYLHIAPFECARCGTAEYVTVRPRVPTLEEYGRLPIRRPLARVWKWRTGLLGE